MAAHGTFATGPARAADWISRRGRAAAFIRVEFSGRLAPRLALSRGRPLREGSLQDDETVQTHFDRNCAAAVFAPGSTITVVPTVTRL
jgi:hypothetical protein